MDKFLVEGGTPIKGSVEISGSKNAVLPIITACLLAPGTYHIHNIPRLRDVRTIAHLMRVIGAKAAFKDRRLIINTEHADFPEAPYELVKTMRASIYVLGPLLARFGKARVSLPGGCAWGPRPVDLHIAGMEKLGATIDLDRGYILAAAPKLSGARIRLEVASVGATGNIMMAAVLAEGETIIENAAREPEIVNLGEFLQRMGANINGLGSETIQIEGVSSLKPADFTVIPDRIEAATYLVAGLISGGEVTATNCEPRHIEDILAKLRAAGADISTGKNFIRLKSTGHIYATDVTTEVYPGYPTDMQAQWIALMSVAEGNSTVTDTIYTDRFTHVPELRRLGANLERIGNRAFIKGGAVLKGAPVMSTDLRASASLVLAALAAEGTTEIQRIYHIDRGYERIEVKLRQLGAKIKRVNDGRLY